METKCNLLWQEKGQATFSAACPLNLFYRYILPLPPHLEHVTFPLPLQTPHVLRPVDDVAEETCPEPQQLVQVTFPWPWQPTQ